MPTGLPRTNGGYVLVISTDPIRTPKETGVLSFLRMQNPSGIGQEECKLSCNLLHT
jgi:hypothetical protein